MGTFKGGIKMGLFSSGDNEEKHAQAAEELLIEGEELEKTYGLLNDFVALTNKRVIFVDKTYLSTQKSVVSIPYNKIEEIILGIGSAFSLSDSIGIVTKSHQHALKFTKTADINGFYKSILKKIC